ncbi:TonB-dependent receptor [Formicincola oecophyllae]|nr:TonB-dependent siderophore receptor [Formicincola oecophyllae]
MSPHYEARTISLGPLGDVKVLDTPFSVGEVRRDVLLNEQLRAITDTAKYLPSVQLEERGDPGLSRPQTRGFEGDIVANTRMDGLNALGTMPYPAEQMDRVDVLNGLAGALYGPQNPSGTFDYITKRPLQGNSTTLNVGADGRGAPLESLDSSQRWGPFAGRLNLLNQNGASYSHGSRMRRNLVSGDFDIHLDEQTVLHLDGSQYSTGAWGLPGTFALKPGIALPRKAPDTARAGYGQKQGGYTTSTSTGLARLEHRFNKDWQVRLGGLYQNAARNTFTVTNTLLNNRGDYNQVVAASTAMDDAKVWSNFAWLNGKARTGFVRHDLVLGSTGYNITLYDPTHAQKYDLGPASLNDPRRVDGPQPRKGGRWRSSNQSVQALIAGDTLHLGHGVSIMGMMGWSWLSVHNWQKSGAPNGHDTHGAAFTPTVAALYKPLPTVTTYFTWGRSIQPGALAPSGSVNVGQTQRAVRSEEYEVGAKWQVNKDLLLSAAAFRMNRPYAFLDPATGVFGNFGMQRNYGVEFMATGHLTKRLAIMAGVTWLDAQLLKTASPLTSHKGVVGVPPVTANVLLDYTLPTVALGKGFSLPGVTALNADFHYVGTRAANVTNTSFAPGYYTLDLGVRHMEMVAHHPVTVRFGVNNVTNQRYWASIYPAGTAGAPKAASTAMAGLPRLWQVTATTAF